VYKLAACAIFRDETERLKEWLVWHRMVGVEHFYLFDNSRRGGADADPLPVLRPYLDADWVTLEPRPGELMQRFAYDLLLSREPPARWIAFIDIDEFLMPLETWRIDHLLARWETPEIAAVNASWAIYGDGHHIAPPPLQLEGFVHRAADYFERHQDTKSLVRPERVAGCDSPHWFYPRRGYQVVDVLGRKLADFRVYPPVYRLLRVNHYRNRTRCEFERKLRRGRAYTPGSRPDDFEYWNRNEIEDAVALRYLPQLQLAMAAPVRPWPAGRLGDHGELVLD
jgi:hypothetical protein